MTDNQSKSVNPNQSGTKPAVSQVDDFLADLKRRRTVTSPDYA
jgi:hypothetical protein